MGKYIVKILEPNGSVNKIEVDDCADILDAINKGGNDYFYRTRTMPKIIAAELVR